MRKTINILFFVVSFLLLNSCSKDEKELLAVESNRIDNLHAPQTSDYSTNPPSVSGDFVKFNF